MKASIDTLLSRGAGSFVAGHDRWIVEGRIDPGCRSAHEHRVLAKVLDLAQSRDGANITNFSSFEYVNRRRQLLEAWPSDFNRGVLILRWCVPLLLLLLLLPHCCRC